LQQAANSWIVRLDTLRNSLSHVFACVIESVEFDDVGL